MPTQRGYNQQNYMPNYFPPDYTSPQGMSQMQSNMGNLHMYGPDGNLLPEHQARFDDYINRVNMAPDPNGQYAQNTPPVLNQQGMPSAPVPPAPVLQQQAGIPIVEGVGQPPMTPEESAAFTAANPQIYDDDTEVTASRRDGTQMGQANKGSGYQKIGLNERLIRLGGAMQGASHLGGNAAMGAFGQEYANMQNADREGLAAYQKAQMDHQTALAKAQGAGGETAELSAQLDSTYAQMQAALDGFDRFESVSGPLDNIFTSALDSSGVLDPERAAFRVQLQKLIVDETLLQTAKTKGAISDSEMALFKSGVPNMAMDERVWKSWISARMENIREMQVRMQSGVRVEPGAGIGFKNAYSITGASPSSSEYTPEDDDELFNF
jgi:hypothetical protein